MALIFMDSSQDYNNTATMLNKYTSGSIAAQLAVTGGFGVRAPTMYKSFSTIASKTLFIGEWINFGQLGLTEQLWAVLDVANVQVSIGTLGDGSVIAYRRANSYDVTPSPIELGRSAPDVVRTSQDYYIEAAITIDPAVGAVQVWVNGGSVLNLSGIQTTNSPVSPFNWNGIQRGFSSARLGAHFYLNDASGSGVFNGRLGAVLVLRDYMASNSSPLNFTPNVGANWQNINDVNGCDGDTTYNESVTALDTDLFTPAPISTADTIIGVQVSVNARRTAAGFSQVAPVIKHSGTTYVGSSGSVGSTYQEIIRNEYEKAPDGTTPWSDAVFNAAKYGYRKTA